MRDIHIRLISMSSGAAVTALLALAAVTMKFGALTIPLLPERSVPVSIKVEPPPPVEPAQSQEVRARSAEPLDIVVDVVPPPIEWTGPNTVADVEVDLGPAIAQPARPVLITRPDWIARPGDLGRYYPARAIRVNREGAVELNCLVGTDGRLACTVLSETPAGYGFGEAALAIARDHQMAPAMRDGVPVEGSYRMRVPFTLQD